ncbi:MAG: UDP-glucose/GDP-mannose dehydrogenase family protein [Fimbriimonadia bacterium]
MNICVVGTGYVGLVTGVVFADLGNDVVCVDKDPNKIAMLKDGKSPIYEPGVEELIARGLAEGRLSFTTDLADACRWAEVVFIAVGTPSGEDGQPDLSQVEAVARSIAHNMNGYKVIVNKSTVPVGTGDWVREILLEEGAPEGSFDVVSNPEFLREGSAVHDTLYPDRIVIGSSKRDASNKLVELYAPLERPMLITDLHSAEMIKYASNSFLAMKISFINAIANLCEACGADVAMVSKGMGADSRIGPQFLQAGLGWGGSCFPKDVLGLITVSNRLGYRFGLLEETYEINKEQPKRFMDKVRKHLGGLRGKTVAVLGLAFKPNTDDLRDAKSIELVRMLLDEGATVRAYDPVAMDGFRNLFPDLTYCHNPYEAAEGADAVLIVTEWNEFKQLNLERLRSVTRQPYLFDGRNIYDPNRAAKTGFRYFGVGRTGPANS